MNKDGSVNMYLYNYGENKPFIDREFPHTFDRNEVYELAIILNSVMDKMEFLIEQIMIIIQT